MREDRSKWFAYRWGLIGATGQVGKPAPLAEEYFDFVWGTGKSRSCWEILEQALELVAVPYNAEYRDAWGRCQGKIKTPTNIHAVAASGSLASDDRAHEQAIAAWLASAGLRQADLQRGGE